MVNRGDVAYYRHSGRLSATNITVDRPLVLGRKLRLKRGVIWTANAVSSNQGNYNATLTVGTNAAAFSVAYPTIAQIAGT